MHLIDLASRPDPETVLARVRDRKARTGSRLSAGQIIEARDSGRR
jgi:hypothetical protein